MDIEREVNISNGYQNYSQRNNEILPNVACGPTNMIQALDYAGWVFPNMYPDLPQPEDQLMKFSRTNEEVLEFYRENFVIMYNQWKDESEKIAKESKIQPWEANCIKSYAPNEVHAVMSFATNLFMGFKKYDLKNNYATYMVERFDKETVIRELDKGLPVVTSVRFGDCGHYITIVGYKGYRSGIIEFIIDNTYGRFNFKTEKYDLVSGDDELINEKELVQRVRPVMHLFKRNALTI